MFSVDLPVSISKTISTAALTVLLAVIGSEASQAADIDIQLATNYAVDPNTGAKVPATLNPSGTADLSYIGNGIAFRYVGHDGKSHTLKVHLDFEFLLNSDPNSKAAATAIFDKINQAGPAATGRIIVQIAERAKAEGQSLTLMMDSQRSPGFYKTDFDLAQIRMLTSDGENVRLQNLVAASFMPKQESTGASAGAPATTATANTAVALKSCEGHFISTL